MKLPFKETALLFVPFLALVGIAIWLNRKPPPPVDDAPFRLWAQSVQRENPTPRDVAEGFDSRVMVKVSYRGRTPDKWGEIVSTYSSACSLLSAPKSNDISGTKFRSHVRSPQFNKEENVYLVSAAFDSRSAPTALKTLRLEIGLNNDYNGYWHKEPSLKRKPEGSFSFAVPHRIPKSLPKVSKYCPLRLHSIRSYDDPSMGATSITIEAVFDSTQSVAPSTPNGARLYSLEPTFLEDENGKQYKSSFGPGIGTDANNLTFLSWRFSRQRLPKKAQNARKLTFKTRVSLGESWPISVSVVLWDKKRSTSSKPASNKPIAQR